MENEESLKAQPVAPAPRMTTQSFADRVNVLIDEAMAEGLRPLPVLASILAKRGVGLIDQGRALLADVADSWLERLEGSRAKTEKK